MMHLNSIWLEGNLISSPQAQESSQETALGFRVASARVFRGQKEVSIFAVVIRNPRILEEAAPLERGQGVRIIGRLEETLEDQDHPITIVAEMVEKRPRFSLCGKNLLPPGRPYPRNRQPELQKP